MTDRPRYLAGRGLLRRPRKLPPHDKGLDGVWTPTSGLIPFAKVEQMMRETAAEIDRMPKRVQDAIREHGPDWQRHVK